ncbi:hypothetical protein SAY87_023745 [Trapa incisa]|uniref:Uncharacterized protein n=1 Tax=Trapa incisa TaxID=236973 RepID=A0AAN7L1Q7_9MYRT|nr:hypothetical protein SAY87_023745 [Trapa incisa]
MADQDSSIDVLEFHIVNPTISIVVVACKGVDVTPKKLARKYVEVCMALDIALHRVCSICLTVMLSWMHEKGIAKMVHSALDIEAELFTDHISTLALAAIYIENLDIVGFSFGAWVACMVWVKPICAKDVKRSWNGKRPVDTVWAGGRCGATGHVRGIHAAVPQIMTSIFKEVEDNKNYHKLLEEKEEVAATIAPATLIGQEDSKAEYDAGE